jgi:transposase
VRRTSIPDAEVFKAAIQDEISRTPEGRYFHRLHAVLHVLDGASSSDTARLYGDSPRAVEYWVQRLTSKGLSGLLDGIRQCQRLFHQLGFSLQRPRRKACEADGPRQEAFKKTTTS